MTKIPTSFERKYDAVQIHSVNKFGTVAENPKGMNIGESP
jgi:hypothetical protein